MTFDPALVAELLGVGLFAGAVGGMFGIGGGVVVIPSLLFLLGAERFGPGSLHLYKLAAQLAAILLSTPSAIRHLRAGAVVRGFVPSIVGFAAAGVLVGVAGAYAFAGEHTYVLRRVFGGFMVVSVGTVMWQQWRGQSSRVDRCPAPARAWRVGLTVGGPAGLVAGLLGVGGGIWAGPAQQLLLGINVRNAIANSACMVAFLAPIAALMQGISVWNMDELRLMDGVWLAVFLGPAGALGAWLGAWLTHVTPVGRVRDLFYAVLILSGLRLLFG